MAMRAALVPTTPPPRIDDPAGRHARHAAEQHARCRPVPSPGMRARLDRHAAGDLAHRRQQRQAAAASVTVS
jgi:hypothetical protein